MPSLEPAVRVLVLGGTTEGRGLALACADVAGVETITSLAGRTSAPLALPGIVRVGRFGGVDGLVAFLRAERIGAVVDATHPFASVMTSHAVSACAAAAVPLLVLRRPGWTASPDDDWRRVPGLAEAAAALPVGARVFLTTGRQGIGAFAGRDDCWFLARSVEPPVPPRPRRLEVLLDRGPFDEASELALLSSHRIDVLVTKDSGGSTAKLTAARAAGLPVIMVDRPPLPPVRSAGTVDEALAWLLARHTSGYVRGV